jgi:hypothetical protein
MNRWAWVVAALYVLVLVVLTLPVALLAFAPQANAKDVAEAYVYWPFWLWVVVMGLSQAALLVVPVHVAGGRPVSRRALLWPVVTAGLMMGGLAVGAVYSVCEFALREKALDGWYWWGAIVAGVFVWAAWAVLFYRSTSRKAPTDVISQQCRMMLRGSILELLIAVPTHIVARHREYCCAGAMTFVGLTLGLSVMLFSFGPAVFFLYADRWRRLRPDLFSRPEGQPPPATPAG